MRGTASKGTLFAVYHRRISFSSRRAHILAQSAHNSLLLGAMRWPSHLLHTQTGRAACGSSTPARAAHAPRTHDSARTVSA
jgi:hypothetical protein